MFNDRLVKLINKLIDSTSNQTVTWSQTEKSNLYRTNISNYGVEIFTKLNRDYNSDDIVVRVTTMTGETLEEFTDVDLKDVLPHSYQIMKGLYDSARRAALGATKAIDDIIDAL